MKNPDKRYRILPIAAFLPAALLCCLLTGGCGPRPDTVEPPTIPPTPDPQAYGSLLYIDGRSVWDGMGLASDRLVAELPFEEIHAVTLADDRLWVLADDQLAVVDLASGTVEAMAEVELSVWGGNLLVLRDRRSVAYAVGMNDNSNLLGHSTRVGLYDPHTGRTRVLTKLIGGVRLLGATPEEDSLYAAQIGGDGGGPITHYQLGGRNDDYQD